MSRSEATGVLSLSLIILFSLLVALAVTAPGCAPRGSVRLKLEELRTLEQCVIAADDQVERQNCVERLIPPASR